MSTKGSVTGWFRELEEGDSDAARALWERYFPRLVEMARQKLRSLPSAVADEEDIAACALESFFRAAENGRFPDLADRYDLWRLLLRITARKVVDLQRRETRRCRGGGRVRNASGFVTDGFGSDAFDLGQSIGREPSPEFVAIMTDECRRLLALLDDPELAALAIAKLEGYRNREIAEQRGDSQRTIERELNLIRRKWATEVDGER